MKKGIVHFLFLLNCIVLVVIGCNKENGPLEVIIPDSSADTNKTISAPSQIWDVYVGPSGRLYVGTFKGLYISSDKGNTWSKSILPLDTTSESVEAILEITPTVVFAGAGGCTQRIGIMKSTDGGATFAPSDNGLTTFCVTSFACKSSDTIFAGTLQGSFRSTNGGLMWNEMNLAVSRRSAVWSIGYDMNGVLLVASSRGLHRSLDGGNSWTAVGQDTSSTWGALTQTSDGAWLAYKAYSGIMRSTDRGVSWISIYTPITDPSAIPSYPVGSHISATAATVNGLAVATTYNKCARSTDNGLTWALCDTVSDANFNSIDVDPAGYIFLGDSKRLYRSTNNGVNWHTLK